MKVIVVSKKDIASMNMKKIFLEKYPFEKTGEKYRGEKIYSYKDFLLITIDTDSIYADFLEKDFKNSEIIIFASRHSSKEKIKSLTVHTDGNFCKATFGGKDFKISYSNAIYNSTALLRLLKFKEEYNLDYKVSFEVTHHGPSIDLKTIWIEVGGSENEWKDMKACEAVVDTIISLEKLERFNEIGIGIGGNHYAPKFTKYVIENKVAIGHIIPRYVFNCIPDQMFIEAIKRTVPEINRIYIDKKGLKKAEKERVMNVLSFKKDIIVKI